VVIECVVNVSEGREQAILAKLAAAATPVLLDVHCDSHHNRSVFTLAGEPGEVAGAVKELARESVASLDLRMHVGVHPRLGIVDVVPFVPYRPGRLPDDDPGVALALRDDFARWLSTTFEVPTFLYGPLPGGQSRTLPQIRRHAFGDMPPDFGPGRPHPSAGATSVGARAVLVAYNVVVSSFEVARRVVPLVRGPAVRALALAVGAEAQVSCNLIDPATVGPAQVFDTVRHHVEEAGGTVTGAELVGLVPAAILRAIPSSRWVELGLSAEATIEARLPR
jgi:glutamate formiminotransferase